MEPWVRDSLAAGSEGEAPAEITYCRDCDVVHMVCRPCARDTKDSTDPRWAEAVQNHDTHKQALDALIEHQLARHPEMRLEAAARKAVKHFAEQYHLREEMPPGQIWGDR